MSASAPPLIPLCQQPARPFTKEELAAQAVELAAHVKAFPTTGITWIAAEDARAGLGRGHKKRDIGFGALLHAFPEEAQKYNAMMAAAAAAAAAAAPPPMQRSQSDPSHT